MRTINTDFKMSKLNLQYKVEEQTADVYIMISKMRTKCELAVPSSAMELYQAVSKELSICKCEELELSSKYEEGPKTAQRMKNVYLFLICVIASGAIFAEK